MRGGHENGHIAVDAYLRVSIVLAAKDSNNLSQVAVIVQTHTAVHCPGDEMVAPVEIRDGTHI